MNGVSRYVGKMRTQCNYFRPATAQAREHEKTNDYQIHWIKKRKKKTN